MASAKNRSRHRSPTALPEKKSAQLGYESSRRFGAATVNKIDGASAPRVVRKADRAIGLGNTLALLLIYYSEEVAR